MTLSRGLVRVAAGAALAGCGWLTGPDERVLLGIIASDEEPPPPLRVPATAVAGRPFTVIVTTQGVAPCTSAGRVDVETAGLTADLTVWDRWPPPGAGCYRMRNILRQEVPLTFAQPGEAVVRLHGRGFFVRADGTVEYPSLTVEAAVRISSGGTRRH